MRASRFRELCLAMPRFRTQWKLEGLSVKQKLIGMGGERETMVVAGGATATEPELEAVEVEIDDRSGEERQKLAHDEAADDGDTERAAEFGASAVAERERKRTEQRGHGGHEDGTE